MTERVSPHDLQSEGAILSLCMIDTELFKRVSPIIRSEDFYSRAHQEIYRACLGVYKSGGLIDVVRVAGWLRDNGKLEMSGGMAYLTEVLNAAPCTFNVVQYAKTVRDKARVRDLIAKCQEIVSRGYSAHGNDGEFLLSANQSVREITRIADRNAMKSNVEALREVFLRIQKNAQEGKNVTGLCTGIRAYDEITTGLHGGQLTVVAARPGGGKSARLLQMVDAVARQGIGCAMFSLEMTAEEMQKRHIAMRASVDATLLELGKLDKGQWTLVTQAVSDISNLPIKIDDCPDLNVHQIRDRAMGAIEDGLSEKKPIGLIAVDYLQRIRPMADDKRRSLAEQVGDVARNLKELAKVTHLPVVAAAQIRRMGGEKRLPNMDDLKASGDIEQEADVVEIIHRDYLYDKKADPTKAVIILGKTRHGRDGMIPVKWRGEFTRFDNEEEY